MTVKPGAGSWPTPGLSMLALGVPWAINEHMPGGVGKPTAVNDEALEHVPQRVRDGKALSLQQLGNVAGNQPWLGEQLHLLGRQAQCCALAIDEARPEDPHAWFSHARSIRKPPLSRLARPSKSRMPGKAGEEHEDHQHQHQQEPHCDRLFRVGAERTSRSTTLPRYLRSAVRGGPLHSRAVRWILWCVCSPEDLDAARYRAVPSPIPVCCAHRVKSPDCAALIPREGRNPPLSRHTFPTV